MIIRFRFYHNTKNILHYYDHESSQITTCEFILMVRKKLFPPHKNDYKDNFQFLLQVYYKNKDKALIQLSNFEYPLR